MREDHDDHEPRPQLGIARGWTNTCIFTRNGGPGDASSEALRVVVLNTEAGTASTIEARRALLATAIDRVGDQGPTVLLTTAGFFGCSIALDGSPSWEPIPDLDALERDLGALMRTAPASLIIAVGVDATGRDQRQWWFAGGEGERRLQIRRRGDACAATALADRRVTHAGFRLLGFVCGETYEWPAGELVEALAEIDVVCVGAHVEVNRIWKRSIDEDMRRWAFQRRFQLIARHAGAALAHTRGTNENYVRNCDDWFVHRGEEPFPGPRVGTPIASEVPRSRCRGSDVNVEYTG